MQKMLLSILHASDIPELVLVRTLVLEDLGCDPAEDLTPIFVEGESLERDDHIGV